MSPAKASGTNVATATTSVLLLALVCLTFVLANSGRVLSAPSLRQAEEPLEEDESRQEEMAALAGETDEMPTTSELRDLRSWAGGDEGELDDEPHGLDTNIANAKVELTPRDMATAAGHHHHHHHSVHGWLEMGAHTGKKGAFGWHDKHPVGGKGRR